MSKIHFTEVNIQEETLPFSLTPILEHRHISVDSMAAMARECIVTLSTVFGQWKKAGQELNLIPVALLGQIADQWMPNEHESISFLANCPSLLSVKRGWTCGPCSKQAWNGGDAKTVEVNAYELIIQVLKEHTISLLKEEWKSLATHDIKEKAKGESEIHNLHLLDEI